jgi:hypothetical protein
MSRKKTKTARQKKQTEAPPVGSGNRQSSLPEVLNSNNLYDYILISLSIAYFLFYFFKLFSSLENTFFWADENVHAYISSVILKTHSIPAVLPDDIYGGFKYSYPPFFHILSALVMAIGGFPALKFTNFILLILFLIGFYFLIRKHYGNSEALLACILISLSPTIAINSVRFMTEMLSMVLIFLSFIFLAAALKKANPVYAIISGLSTGLLLLSKQLGIVVLGFYFLLLVWFFLKHKEDVRLVLYVIGTSACIFIPYFIWAVYNEIEVFGFLSIFFGTKAEWATAAVKSFRRHDSSIKEFAYLFYNGNGVVISAAFLMPIYHFIRSRAKDRPQNYIFIMTVYLAVVMIVWHITNPRHTITLLPLITVLFGYAVRQVITSKIAIRAIIVCLLIIAGYFAFQMPNYRKKFNAPGEFIELNQIIQKDNTSNGKTLVVHWFDTVMYSGKPVIWPNPDLRTIPINLFEKQSPDKLYDLLMHYNIDYILIDVRFVSSHDNFIGRNYPLAFVRNCETLEKQGKVRLQALSGSKMFILLKVS